MLRRKDLKLSPTGDAGAQREERTRWWSQRKFWEGARVGRLLWDCLLHSITGTPVQKLRHYIWWSSLPWPELGRWVQQLIVHWESWLSDTSFPIHWEWEYTARCWSTGWWAWRWESWKSLWWPCLVNIYGKVEKAESESSRADSWEEVETEPMWLVRKEKLGWEWAAE